MEHGEYAVRGGIIDLFPAGEAEPLRLDFFGDEIEDMRRFDTASQRSGKVVPALSLRPVGEVFLDEASRTRFRSGYRELFGAAAADDPLYGAISAGRRYPGMEHWAGLFHDNMVPLLDYMLGAEISFDHQAEEVLKARLEMITDHYEARRVPSRIGEGDVPYRPAPPATLYLDEAGWAAMLADCRVLRFSPFAVPDGIAAGGRPGPLFAEARSAGENVFAAYAAMVQGEESFLAKHFGSTKKRLLALAALIILVFIVVVFMASSPSQHHPYGSMPPATTPPFSEDFSLKIFKQ
jgi:transcription-repair coupling factor (superfamily II helicase)